MSWERSPALERRNSLELRFPASPPGAPSQKTRPQGSFENENRLDSDGGPTSPSERLSFGSTQSGYTGSSRPSFSIQRQGSLVLDDGHDFAEARCLSKDSSNGVMSPPGSPSKHRPRRLSKDSTSSRSSGERISAITREVVQKQTQVRDGSEVYSVSIIMCAVLVAAACGVAAFALHLAVFFSGCLGGVNGCNQSVLLDVLKPLGINKSLYFTISAGCSGLLCSCIIYSPWKNGVARNCVGGGSVGTKIAVSAGQQVSGWIVVLRIILAGLYLGGGNALGTEGPVIHLGAELGTYLTSLAGTRSRKIVSMFGVIGASAGISAGFNTLITGFIYTTEEVTRTLSRRLALILTLAALVALIVKDNLERLLEHWLHLEHVSLVPPGETLDKLTTNDILWMLLLSIPIGILNGMAGWCFTRLAWGLRCLLSMIEKPSQPRRLFLPRRSHLAIIGIITGAFGAVAYETTGVNGVWGTTFGAIPETIAHGVTWNEALLLFLMKFLSFALATAGGGPGGMLVPSLVTGGFLGLFLGLLIVGAENNVISSACAVVGMGSLFSSIMHLPVSGVIIIFELTESKSVILPVVLANFISSNVAARLPHGEHSFAHLCLEHDERWKKLGKQDFIETDAHATSAEAATTASLKNHAKDIKLALMEVFDVDSKLLGGPKLIQNLSEGLVNGNGRRERTCTSSRSVNGIFSIHQQIQWLELVCTSKSFMAWRSWLITDGSTQQSKEPSTCPDFMLLDGLQEVIVEGVIHPCKQVNFDFESYPTPPPQPPPRTIHPLATPQTRRHGN